MPDDAVMADGLEHTLKPTHPSPLRFIYITSPPLPTLNDIDDTATTLSTTSNELVPRSQTLV